MSTVNLITGGSGFIGSNLAHQLLAQGERVILFDNLSRPDVHQNLAWLRDLFGAKAELQLGDVRDEYAVRHAVERADNVFHFAAQVAVTTSLVQPLLDFDVNARGTLHVLEAIRTRRQPPNLFFTSTNKVYGALRHLPLRASPGGYQPRDEALARQGISEATPLEFHSPYGCSKGSADQYVLDYARSYELPCVVFRMSCIYGPRQFGTEDQGWLAHFAKRTLLRQPITIYGDGHQTRDVLFVDDLLQAFFAARTHISLCRGRAFNIGGGPANAVSVLTALGSIAAIIGHLPDVAHEAERTGDQRYYVSDTSKFTELTGWRPAVPVEEGLVRLVAWMKAGVLGWTAPGAVSAAPRAAAERPTLSAGAQR